MFKFAALYLLIEIAFGDELTQTTFDSHHSEVAASRNRMHIGDAGSLYGKKSMAVAMRTGYASTVPPSYHYMAGHHLAAADDQQRPHAHGKVLTSPMEHHIPPPIVPSLQDASYRTVGGVRLSGGGLAVPVPPSIGVGRSPDIYGPRDFGERHGDFGIGWRTWDRSGYPNHGHVDGFLPGHHQIIDPDDDLLLPDDDGDDDDDDALANASGHNQRQLNGGGGGGALAGATPFGECEIDCERWEFFCVRSCACVHKDNRCDNTPQCSEGEDEQDCENGITVEEMTQRLAAQCELNGTRVLCPLTYTCIMKTFLCDGDDDCGDFSDETHCGARRNCSDDQFECQNGFCIPQSWQCDGDNDCKDQSDELNCTRLPCTAQEFQCGDGSCVSLSFRCDGEPDCGDGTDEGNCEPLMPNCPEGEFKCRGSSIVGGSAVGGGASGGGGSGSTDGSCILGKFRCDGDNDCGDWSDEDGCPKKAFSCTADEYRCENGDCIPARWRCDREQDCDSGEDEKGCTVDGKDRTRKCNDDEFGCEEGKCILKSWICDGVMDCNRGEDELNCEVHCEIGQFLCPPQRNTTAKICVNQKHICDTQSDCPNGEDEKNCPKPHSCTSKSKCEQLCVVSAKGKEECACRLGFVLSANKQNCTDINECQFETNPMCSQKCVNTPGSFTCSCVSGYILRPDLRTCKALGGAVKLIMANRGDIRQVSLSNNKYTSVVKGLHNAIALDYHYARDLLFWTDVSMNAIKMSFFNGTEMRDIVKWGLESPCGVAIDWIHDLLFWTDSGTRRIEVVTFDGLLRAVIAANDLDKPRAIVVHPGEAFVFWTDWGPSPKIERSFMDGSDRTSIIGSGVFWPNGLAIDYPAGKLYWADAKHHVIENSNFDGRDRKKILNKHLPHPFALTLFEDLMYWTDWHTKNIAVANKLTGTGFRFVHEGIHLPMDIHSYHQSRQPVYANRCAKDRNRLAGGCSHLCLPSGGARRCGCPIGLSLKDDQRTCTAVPDKLMLVARKKDIRIRQIDGKSSFNTVDMVIPLDGLKAVGAVDWCHRTDRIYWSDSGRSSISRAFLNGSDQQTIFQENSDTPSGVALDWISDKVYWTDTTTNRIQVVTADGQKRALVIWEGLQQPHDIALSPAHGLMFWSDLGTTPVIERASMDGAQRRVLLAQNLHAPMGMSVDEKNTRLYFVDSGRKVIEFVSFDGGGRTEVVGAAIKYPIGIDVYAGNIYWTDKGTQLVEMIDQQTKRNRRVLIANTTDLMDIRVFHRERTDPPNPCAKNNGGCSYMCLLNSDGHHSCLCPIGVRIKADNRTCGTGPDSYVIIAHRIDIRQVSLDLNYSIDVVLPLPPIINALAVDVDRRTGDVYWSDTKDDIIVKSSPDGMQGQQVTSDGLDNVEGLVIDSVGRKIYWTDSGRHVIEVSELDGGSRKILIWYDLKSPRGIAIHYKTGYLFWTDWGENPRIERAEMDGGSRRCIISLNLGWPNGLAVDSAQQLIYWTDAQLKHIESCTFDGNGRKTVLGNLPHPYGLAVTRTQLYWTDWRTTALHVMEKNDLQTQRIIKKGLEGLMDVKVVELGEHERDVDVCRSRNGGCSHLCLRNRNGYSCQCPTGTKLLPKSTAQCELQPSAYLLIALRTGIARISLDTTEMFDVVLPIEGVHGSVALDFHYTRSLLFYADVNSDAIRRIDLHNMSNTQTIVAHGLTTTNGLAIDWVADNIFWTDTAMKVMEVARLDGSSRKIILRNTLDDPRAMAVLPRKGWIFWADWGKSPKIERCLMDGSERMVLVENDLGYPTGIAIDYEARKLYWADALHDRIELVDFDGQKRTVSVPHATRPFGVTLYGSHIYWTDWYNKSVFRVLKVTNSTPEEIRTGLKGALEVKAVANGQQPDDWTPCAEKNGGCTHLCLFKGTSYVCACPDQNKSTSNHKPCQLEPLFKVSLRRSDTADDGTDYTNDKQKQYNTVVAGDKTNENKTKANIMIAAICIVAILFVVVMLAILVLFLGRKKKSVLTFSNPNYNGADPLNPPEVKTTIWKRLKYDKATERVYEEKYLGGGGRSSELATTTLIRGTPSPVASPLAAKPLSIIG